jgi:hypothetical protein
MIKALWLLVNPEGAWESIRLNHRKTFFILVTYLLPFIIASCFVEGYGLWRWGRVRGEFSQLTHFPKGEIIIYEAAQAVLTLLVVLIGTKLVKSVGETFHGRHTTSEVFTAVAFGMSPLLLARCVDALPGISLWITWSVGILLTMSLLYKGLPVIMRPDPPHAFGLFFMSSLLLLLVTGLVRFSTAWYLHGKFPLLEKAVIDLGARLPF